MSLNKLLLKTAVLFTVATHGIIAGAMMQSRSNVRHESGIPPVSLARPPAIQLEVKPRLPQVPEAFDPDVDSNEPQSTFRKIPLCSDCGRSDNLFLWRRSVTSMFFSDPVFAAWSSFLLIVAILIIGSRRMLVPLRKVTVAVRDATVLCTLPHSIREEGTSKSRQLIRAFNDMSRNRNDAMRAQSAALAALAQHLEYHAGRLRGRALLVAEWHTRAAFVEDIDLFLYLSKQLVQVSRQSAISEVNLPVDEFLRDRFLLASSMDTALFICDCNAGPRFRLPRTLLERLVSNLIDNALEHGLPPIAIETWLQGTEWVLSIRDHGRGIKLHEISAATMPFVRLNNADTVDRHWGLGLALVASLVKTGGGRLILDNHPEGGVWARAVFTAQ